MTVNPLSELINDRLAELGISVREAADRSGGGIKHTSIIRLRAGAYRGRRIGPDTIAALALALDLPEHVVAEAADGQASLPEPPAGPNFQRIHCGDYVRHREQDYGRGHILRIITDEQLGTEGRIYSSETYYIEWDGLVDHGGRGLHAREELVSER